MKKNVFLIGFMGAGKSTAARYLHETYGMEWLEMDKEIGKREGMAISRIFETKGEEYFRSLETELLSSLENRENLVVSCGGGVPLRSCNVDIMHRTGKIVFLTASPETILSRVRRSHSRPLLENNKNTDYIASLLNQRLDRYEAAADAFVATDGRTTQEVGEEIKKLLDK